MMQPNSSARSHSSGSGAEVAVHAEDAVGDDAACACRAAAPRRSARAAATSRCGKTLIVARLRRAPSMMLAWFSSSETMTSSRPRIDETVPALAVKPLWKTTAASVRLNSASFRSSSMWMSMVPAMVRTEPDPTPNAPQRVERALAQLRVRRQSEIVVRGQIDDRAVVDRGARLLLAVEHAQPAIESLVAQRLQLGRRDSPSGSWRIAPV